MRVANWAICYKRKAIYYTWNIEKKKPQKTAVKCLWNLQWNSALESPTGKILWWFLGTDEFCTALGWLWSGSDSVRNMYTHHALVLNGIGYKTHQRNNGKKDTLLHKRLTNFLYSIEMQVIKPLFLKIFTLKALNIITSALFKGIPKFKGFMQITNWLITQLFTKIKPPNFTLFWLMHTK